MKTPNGSVFIVGYNGDSELGRWGSLWKSFRLFEVTGRYQWGRRIKTVDPVTGLERDNGQLENLGLIYGAIEPLEREAFDREVRNSFEQQRFISGQILLRDDVLDGRQVIRSDPQLGICVSTLS